MRSSPWTVRLRNTVPSSPAFRASGFSGAAALVSSAARVSASAGTVVRFFAAFALVGDTAAPASCVISRAAITPPPVIVRHRVMSAALPDAEVEGDRAPLLAGPSARQRLEAPAAQRLPRVLVEVLESGRLLDQDVLLDAAVGPHD